MEAEEDPLLAPEVTVQTLQQHQQPASPVVLHRKAAALADMADGLIVAPMLVELEFHLAAEVAAVEMTQP